MANPLDIRDIMPDRRWISSNPYLNLALANDTVGVDRDSIENDLWVNIVDVVILVSSTNPLSTAPRVSPFGTDDIVGLYHHWGWIDPDQHVVTRTQRKRGYRENSTGSGFGLFGSYSWVRRSG